MKKKLIVGALFMVFSSSIGAAERLDLKMITSGEFAAQRVLGINPIEGTDQYASISDDGKRIVQYSFKTGKESGVLFDVENTQGSEIKDFDGYFMSPDGNRMLIQTKTKSVYRHSATAEYYIYNVHSRKLEPLSAGGPQQVPTWSPDGNQGAFVREGNIFIV